MRYGKLHTLSFYEVQLVATCTLESTEKSLYVGGHLDGTQQKTTVRKDWNSQIA